MAPQQGRRILVGTSQICVHVGYRGRLQRRGSQHLLHATTLPGSSLGGLAMEGRVCLFQLPQGKMNTTWAYCNLPILTLICCPQPSDSETYALLPRVARSACRRPRQPAARSAMVRRTPGSTKMRFDGVNATSADPLVNKTKATSHCLR